MAKPRDDNPYSSPAHEPDESPRWLKENDYRFRLRDIGTWTMVVFWFSMLMLAVLMSLMISIIQSLR